MVNSKLHQTLQVPKIRRCHDSLFIISEPGEEGTAENTTAQMRQKQNQNLYFYRTKLNFFRFHFCYLTEKGTPKYAKV